MNDEVIEIIDRNTSKRDIYTEFLNISNLPHMTQKLVKKYFSLKVLANVVYLISSTFYILFILERLNYSQFGLIISIGLIFRALTDYPTGVIADWLGQKYVLFIAYICHAISFTMLALVSKINSNNVFVYCTILYVIESFALSVESGALQSWFDNNYKLSLGAIETQQEIYSEIFGKSIMMIRFFGGIAILFGGFISTIVSRESVFLLQGFLMLLLSVAFLFLLEDFQERSKENFSFQDFTKLFNDGLLLIFRSRLIFFFVIAYVLLIVTNLIWVNLIIIPLYYGYTGSDSLAAVLRSILFVSGAFVTILSINLAKSINIKIWLPKVIFVFSISFYGIYALILFILPYNNGINFFGLVCIFIAAMIGNFLGSIWMLLIQRYQLDIIPDENRNSFYSISPTLGLITGSISIVYISSIIDQNDLPIIVVKFLLIPSVISAICLSISLRDFQDKYKEEDPIINYLNKLNTTISGIEVSFGISRIPNQWKIKPIIKASFLDLVRIALDDGIISKDENILITEFVEEMITYGRMLENTLIDGEISQFNQKLLRNSLEQFLIRTYSLANLDLSITEEEQLILTRLEKIIPEIGNI